GVTTFIWYWLVVALNALLFVYIGQLLVYALPTVAVATTAGALLSSIFMLFSGFNPPASNIPIGYKWIYYISPPTYTIAILVALVFADSDGFGSQTITNAPPTVGNITLKQYVENAFNMKHDDIPRNVLILCVLIVAFRLLALLSLRYISHLKR
ncbi:Pleiotropic drug resistance protein transporter, partial [Phytophthora megakarya]